MKIALVVNFEKEKSVDIAKKTIDIISSKAEILCDENTYNVLKNRCIIISKTPFEECDICIIIGGDGTILHNAKNASLHGKEILGINTGRIGYLAGLEEDELDKLLLLFEEKYNTEERIMLDVYHKTDKGEHKYIAFNDAVISKGSLSRMIDIELFVGEHHIPYRSDGLIMATPTGSTAYSMSAGGPVVDPSVKNIIITPICPYSYFTRSLVLPSQTEISVSVDLKDEREAFLNIDGEIAVKISNGETVKITQSATKVKLINLKFNNIYNCLERVTGGYSK